MLLTCDGDRHVYQWSGADVSAPPPGTVCKCSQKTIKDETPQAQIADLTARLDQAQAMILERDNLIAELTESLAGRYNLKALELCADAAIFEAETQIAQFEGEAINWGDLVCVGAEWYVGADDNTGYRVWIEEVDPAAYRLRDFIREHLTRHGFSDVDVMLEW